jgi:hypothetical protein
MPRRRPEGATGQLLAKAAQRGGEVLRPRPLVLAFGDDAARWVHEPHRRFRLVPVLPAWTARPVDLHLALREQIIVGQFVPARALAQAS